MSLKWTETEWFDRVRVGVAVSVVASMFYAGYEFYQRSRISGVEPQEPRYIDLHDDLYVHPPKSYVSNLESAKRKLVGMPLWAMEGYRWAYEPGEATFDPIEKIVPTAIVVRRGEVQMVFEKDDKSYRFAIGSPERVYVDNLFFSKDPRELYDHWSPEMWRKVDAHEVEVGMSEMQIAFALGAGQVIRQSTGSTTRVVEYTLCKKAGLQPVRVTYNRNVSTAVEPIEAEDPA